jgi:hypothetical protein
MRQGFGPVLWRGDGSPRVLAANRKSRTFLSEVSRVFMARICFNDTALSLASNRFMGWLIIQGEKAFR